MDSVGVVKRQSMDDEELFQGTLETLVRKANEGYVTTIEFDSSLKNSTFELKTHNSILQPGYIAFNSETNQWTEVTPKLPLDRNGNPDDSILAGPTAFNILGDLTIDGGNLGITLKGDGTTRAFYIKPDVWFGLSNITLANFAANGAAGQLDNQNNLAQIPGSIGGSAGEGGAILNRGWTTLTNVNFSDNRSQGGVGSKSNQTPQILNTQEGLQNLSGDSLSDISLGISWDEDMPSGITIASPNSPGQSFNGGGYMGGVGGDAIPVTLTYTLGDDPTLRTATVMIAGAGGGGSGLGGAIYNAEDGTLIITGGSSFTANSVQAGKAGSSPEFITNLANAIFGDYAHTVSVTGFENSWLTRGTDGAALAGAIFNKGTVIISDSSFLQNSASDMGAAIYSLGGTVSLTNTALLYNQSHADQGIHFVPDSHGKGDLQINNSLIKGQQSSLSGKPIGPEALVVEGGQSSGFGNVITSQSGFAGSGFNAKVIQRPQSPFTGEVFLPSNGGPQVAFGVLAGLPSRMGSAQPEPGKSFELTFRYLLASRSPRDASSSEGTPNQSPREFSTKTAKSQSDCLDSSRREFLSMFIMKAMAPTRARSAP